MKHIIQQEHKFPPNRGALKDKKDHRDYNALELMAGVDVVIPTFKEGYSVRQKYYPNMKYKNQYQTFGCTGFAWSLYKEVLQKIDTGEETELSPFSLYNPVAQPGVGAYIRDPGMRTKNYGVNKEATLPTPPDEATMTRKFDFTPYAQEAAFYKNRVIASVNTQNFDDIARMIFLNHGVVSGWNGHCVYFDEYGIGINGQRYIKTMNSYGEGNDLYLYESDRGKLYSIWTAIDLSNTDMANPNLLLSDLKLGDTGRQVEKLLNALAKLGWKLDFTPTSFVYDASVADLVSRFKLANTCSSFWARWIEKYYLKGRSVVDWEREIINNLIK